MARVKFHGEDFLTAIQNMLTVNERSKSIPYPAATNADSQNYGFRVLKGKPDKVDRVKEASDLPALIGILKSLNSSASPFFSVGCEKSFNESTGGLWAKGYVEFAFNYAKLVSDAAQYFPLFFHFNKDAAAFLGSNNVQFRWDLQPAKFEAIDLAGFSCCVWITTGRHSSLEATTEIFSDALGLLQSSLDRYGEPEGMIPIYGAGA